MNVDDPLAVLLQRLDSEPPNFHAEEFPRSQVEWRCQMEAAGILRSISASTFVSCLYCGDVDDHKVNFLEDQRTGGKRGYICCRECGVVEVPPERLQRWTVDLPTFLHATFSRSGVTIRPTEATAGHLWKIGKATWAGRSREVWFGRVFRQAKAAEILKPLSGHRKSILFTPSDLGAARWQEATENLVIALESTLSLEDGNFSFDTGYVESRIVDAGLGFEAAPRTSVKRRGERTVNIELLTREVIEHLRAARDHAFATLDRTGQPELLRRPLRKELGARVGLPSYEVSKCFHDQEARELNLYWKIAGNLEEIMRWKSHR